MLQNLVQILLIVLICLQIGLMIYLFYINRQREKYDKKFYEKMLKDLETQQATFLDEIGGVQCEQASEDPSEE